MVVPPSTVAPAVSPVETEEGFLAAKVLSKCTKRFSGRP